MSVVQPLPDVLAPGLSVVFCGTAVGETSAARGAYYAGPGNAFWATLHAVGLTPRVLAPKEFTALPAYGVGLTDLAKHRAGNDDVLESCDFDVPAFVAKVRRFAPRAVAFNGKRAAAVFYRCRTRSVSCGCQRGRLGATDLWVLPSTSAAARSYWDIEPWQTLAAWARAASR